MSTATCMKYLRSVKRSCDFSGHWDVFVSAFNGARRTSEAFDRIDATKKLWVLLPEYGYSKEEAGVIGPHLPIDAGDDEAVVAAKIFDAVGLEGNTGCRICIDITGFMRPHIVALVGGLAALGVARYDMLYTEPGQYKRKEHTEFVGCDVDCVRQVIGFEGVHTDEVSGDLLIVGVGYDDTLISRVANDKDGARLVHLMSLPSLSADMYQESVLRLDRTDLCPTSEQEDGVFFAPANDPFVIAYELSMKVAELRSRSDISNLYLSPLATKVQALGFALFYQTELVGSAASILFPFAQKYERETSVGIGSSWVYEIE